MIALSSSGRRRPEIGIVARYLHELRKASRDARRDDVVVPERLHPVGQTTPRPLMPPRRSRA